MASLTPEELLTTTRAVRKRLDLEKPVELDLFSWTNSMLTRTFCMISELFTPT
jgi:hypothetical protein